MIKVKKFYSPTACAGKVRYSTIKLDPYFAWFYPVAAVAAEQVDYLKK